MAYKHNQDYHNTARTYYKEGFKLQAVKLIWQRSRTKKFGLKEAKQFVDDELFNEE